MNENIQKTESNCKNLVKEKEVKSEIEQEIPLPMSLPIPDLANLKDIMKIDFKKINELISDLEQMKSRVIISYILIVEIAIRYLGRKKVEEIFKKIQGKE